MSARLTSGFWVSAYLNRLRLAAVPAYVTQRGDADAGAVLVKCATLDGRAALWGRQFDPLGGGRAWERIAEAPEAEIDARLARERSRDPDLWILEIEARDGETLLEEPGFEG